MAPGSLLGRVAASLLERTNLDLRALSWRLARLRARHVEVSAIASMDDAPGQASSRLLDLVAPLVAEARRAELPLLVARGAPPLVSVWPGEHYRLLAAIVAVVQPTSVVEIGTASGLSALAMLPGLSAGGRLVTFDIVPWRQSPDTFLRELDFDGRLVQRVADLGRPEVAREHAATLKEADLIFIDAAKDGRLEFRLLDNLDGVGLKPGALVVLDDIRVWNMLDVWRGISRPKLDLTSLGHWSGTGIVDWGAPGR